MCLSCKKKVWSTWINSVTGSPISFNANQLNELKRKSRNNNISFQKITKNKTFIDKQQFRQNLGILGLRTAELFSDRLFCSFDLDGDGEISFNDFAQYMDILRNGRETHKAFISFRMIDIHKKKWFDKKAFREFMSDFLRAWSFISNHSISKQINKRTDEYIQNIFDKVKEVNKNSNSQLRVDFDHYQKYIYKDNQFTSAFDFITQGVANFFFSKNTEKEQKFEQQFQKIETELSFIYKQLYQNESEDFDIGQESKPNKIPIFKKAEFPIRFSAVRISLPQFRNDRQVESNTVSTQFNSTAKKPSFAQEKLKTVKVRFQNLLTDVRLIKQKIQQQHHQQNLPNMLKKKRNTVANVHKKLSEGKMVFIGDTNWNLVLNMMIGIQMAIRSVKGYQQMIYQQPQDFGLKYYFELVPRRFGGQKNQNLSHICKFTDYAPNTFNHIRKIFGIDNQEYIKSIGPDKLLASLLMGEMSSMTELTSQGKSGSFFYYTADGQYMLKTIHQREYSFLKDILKDYYYYLAKNPKSLITKFFGLHKLVERTDSGNTIRKHYFVIMANVFNTSQKITERYDVKGSTVGRTTLDADEKATRKDNDFLKRKPLEIDNSEAEELINIIKKDAQFFQQHDVIDYSLLIGVLKKSGDWKLRKSMPVQQQFSYISINQELTGKMYYSLATNEKYLFGIIDILTKFDTRKKAEYCFKRIIYGEGISAIPPGDYAERFYNFIKAKVFKL